MISNYVIKICEDFILFNFEHVGRVGIQLYLHDNHNKKIQVRCDF